MMLASEIKANKRNIFRVSEFTNEQCANLRYFKGDFGERLLGYNLPGGRLIVR